MHLPAKSRPGDDDPGAVLVPTRVWKVHLALTAQARADMEPFLPTPVPGSGATPAARPIPADVHKGAGMGITFPWVRADLEVDGKSYRGVGLRYKGNASYGMASRGLRRNYRIDLDHYGAKRRHHGLESILLHAGALDPSRLRESLSFAVFRAAGVPAPRTAYAELALTLPGRAPREFVGLYTVIEPVDRTFLRDRFHDGRGMLLKPEGVREIAYLGDDWSAYAPRYLPKGDPPEAARRRLIAFAHLIDRGSDDDFRTRVGDFLDIDAFLRFVAVNALLVTVDNFFTSGHNFYLYLDPRTDRFVFIPWDMDVSLAGVPFVGTAEQRMDLSLMHPHPGRHRLLDRLLAIDDVRGRYRSLIERLVAGPFSPASLRARIDALDAVAAPRRVRETRAAAARGEPIGEPGFGFVAGKGMFGQGPDPRVFVARRHASIAAQLSGARPGWVPDGAFGPPQNPLAELGPRFDVFREPVQAALGLDDDQRRRLKAWSGPVEGRLRALQEEMARLRPEERGPRSEAFRRDADRQLGAVLETVLTPPQRLRLREIALQREGPFVFLQPDVATELGLTDGQRQRAMATIQALQRAAESLMRRLQAGADPSEIGPKIQALRREHAARLEGLLTPEQADRWRRMRGAPVPSPDAP